MLKRKTAALLTAAASAFTMAAPLFSALPVNAEDTSSVIGDINSDGAVGIADVELLQDYLLSSAPLSQNQKSAADICTDGKLNVFDLSALKKLASISIGSEKLSKLMINEVCTSNKTSYTDATGAEPDWIELYNASDSALDISGIGVSDGAKNKYKFAFPDGTVIPADGYIIICCDDAVNQAEGEYHAAFKLSASGETIYLTHPQYGEIDSVAVPELEKDTSYGRFANGSENFTHLTCTPAATNDTAKDLQVVEKPLFSAEGGFYDAAFDLSLSDPNGNEIWYTTDGSDPASSETAQLYSGTINIYNNTNDPNVWSAVRAISLMGYTPPSSKVDKGIIIRAVCKTSDGRCSGTATNSYFVGKTASYYSDMKVVSLVTDSDYLFNEDTGAYMIGSGYYEWKNSPEYIEYEENDSHNPTNYNKDGKESEFPVNIQVFENGKAEYSSDVGARISGNWTRAYPQKSLRLYARSEYGDSKMRYAFFDELTDINGNTIKEFDKVTLSNGGGDCPYLHFRDALIQDIAEDGGLSIDYMASEPCMVFIDGEFWGFYLIREKVDGDYIESHYGVDKDNAAVIKNGSVEEGTEADVTEFDEFCKWASAADMTDEANYQKACDTVDIESFMDYVALETYICNCDWAPTYLNNWMIWKSRTPDPSIPKADGKWRFVLYDTDNSAGMYHNIESSCDYDMLSNLYDEAYSCNYLAVFYNLMNNKDFRDRFYANYTDVIDNCFETGKVNAKINEYVAAYRTATLDSVNRFNFSWYSSYDDELDYLRAFFNNRPGYARIYLDRFYNSYENAVPSGENILPPVSEWTFYGDGTFSADSSNSTFTAVSNSVGSVDWDTQAQALGVPLEKGKTYMLSFEASCTADNNMTLGLIRYDNGNHPVSWSGIAPLTSEMQEYTFAFTMPMDTYDDWFLYFNFASAVGTFNIRNACLKEVKNLITDSSKWMLYDASGIGASLNITDANTLSVNVPALPANTYDMQIYYTGLRLAAGKTYTYSVLLESDAETQIKAKVEQNYGDYANYHESYPETSPIISAHSSTFTAAEDCTDAKLCMNLGYATGTYKISDIIWICHD